MEDSFATHDTTTAKMAKPKHRRRHLLEALQAPSFGGIDVQSEPVHGEIDVLYSGSEDGYYDSAVERSHRHLGLARQLLRGQTPRLFSASLRGPFDSNTGWKNPWTGKGGRAVSSSADLTHRAESPDPETAASLPKNDRSLLRVLKWRKDVLSTAPKNYELGEASSSSIGANPDGASRNKRASSAHWRTSTNLKRLKTTVGTTDPTSATTDGARHSRPGHIIDDTHRTLSHPPQFLSDDNADDEANTHRSSSVLPSYGPSLAEGAESEVRDPASPPADIGLCNPLAARHAQTTDKVEQGQSDLRPSDSPSRATEAIAGTVHKPPAAPVLETDADAEMTIDYTFTAVDESYKSTSSSDIGSAESVREKDGRFPFQNRIGKYGSLEYPTPNILPSVEVDDAVEVLLSIYCAMDDLSSEASDSNESAAMIQVSTGSSSEAQMLAGSMEDDDCITDAPTPSDIAIISQLNAVSETFNSSQSAIIPQAASHSTSDTAVLGGMQASTTMSAASYGEAESPANLSSSELSDVPTEIDFEGIQRHFYESRAPTSDRSALDLSQLARQAYNAIVASGAVGDEGSNHSRFPTQEQSPLAETDYASLNAVTSTPDIVTVDSETTAEQNTEVALKDSIEVVLEDSIETVEESTEAETEDSVVEDPIEAVEDSVVEGTAEAVVEDSVVNDSVVEDTIEALVEDRMVENTIGEVVEHSIGPVDEDTVEAVVEDSIEAVVGHTETPAEEQSPWAGTAPYQVPHPADKSDLNMTDTPISHVHAAMPDDRNRVEMQCSSITVALPWQLTSPRSPKRRGPGLEQQAAFDKPLRPGHANYAGDALSFLPSTPVIPSSLSTGTTPSTPTTKQSSLPTPDLTVSIKSSSRFRASSPTPRPRKKGRRARVDKNGLRSVLVSPRHRRAKGGRAKKSKRHVRFDLPDDVFEEAAPANEASFSSGPSEDQKKHIRVASPPPEPDTTEAAGSSGNASLQALPSEVDRFKGHYASVANRSARLATVSTATAHTAQATDAADAAYGLHHDNRATDKAADVKWSQLHQSHLDQQLMQPSDQPKVHDKMVHRGQSYLEITEHRHEGDEKEEGDEEGSSGSDDDDAESASSEEDIVQEVLNNLDDYLGLFDVDKQLAEVAAGKS